MGFRYKLRDPAGKDLGDAEYAYQPRVGDVIHIAGTQRARVLAFDPVEVVVGHPVRPVAGFLDVELLDEA